MFRSLAFATILLAFPIAEAHAQNSGLRCRTVTVETADGPQRQRLCLASDGRWYPGVALGQGGPRQGYYRPAPQYYPSGGGQTSGASQYSGNQQPPTAGNQAQITQLDQAIDGLVALDAQSWAWNHYDRGSVHDSQVIDTSGTRYTVYGRYTYNGGEPGWVKIQFDGKTPQCVEFHDFAGNCRAIGHSPGQAYALGAVAVIAVAIVASSSSGNSSSGGSGSSSGYSSGPTPGDYYNEKNHMCDGGDADACAAAGRAPPSDGQ
ncbi:MAG TPA: hypothetical protein VGG48_18675 [Rhizomicrobium sp.]|jgi:hypothetical protein